MSENYARVQDNSGSKSLGDINSGIEMASIDTEPIRQSTRVDASSVKHVMESIMRTTMADKLDLEKSESEEIHEHHSIRENDEFEGDDTESKRTRRNSLTSRVRTER